MRLWRPRPVPGPNPRPRWRTLRPWLAALLAKAVILTAGVWIVERVTGTDITVHFGGLFWIPVDRHTPWLGRSARLALGATPPHAEPGALQWRALRPGFEVAQLPVLVGKQEADRILLARIDPARYRFQVRNDPSGRRRLDDWMADLRPLMVINGSFYDRAGRPATPAVIDGAPAGPARYDANQGAFVSSRQSTRIVDLARQDWRAALRGSDSAMVSYPLLLAEDGSSRAPVGTGWLANRSFLGQDRQGRILLGTTQGAFFSLDRLADFLRRAPLDLDLALDLDGGPVACQAVELGDFHRRHCGLWEIQVDPKGQARMIPTWPFRQPAMPMALAVYGR
jgi:hypothetical protein